MANDNILTVSLKNDVVMAGTLYQYDYGQRIVFTDADLPMSYEVHFANSGDASSVTVIGDSTGVDIPDALLLTGKSILAWIYLHTGEDDGETEYQIMINVSERATPTNQEPTPVQQDEITQLMAQLNNAISHVSMINDEAGSGDTTETWSADKIIAYVQEITGISPAEGVGF